jgi:hypothetical protein
MIHPLRELARGLVGQGALDAQQEARPGAIGELVTELTRAAIAFAEAILGDGRSRAVFARRA